MTGASARNARDALGSFRRAEGVFRFRFQLALDARRSLVDAAVQLLLAGVDTPNVRILAGEDDAPEAEVEHYLEQALRDLRLSPLSMPEAAVQAGHFIAGRLLAGQLDTGAAARQLWNLYVAADYPSALSDLGAAAEWVIIDGEVDRSAHDDLAVAARRFVGLAEP